MSSMIVYGKGAPIGKNKMITRDTVPSPENFYGDSKLKAENGIRGLKNDHFKTVILRPPMIYGRNAKGNYAALSAYAKKLNIFPEINNQRSMLYIENFCEFVRLLIDHEESGLFFPQNEDYVGTSQLFTSIAQVHGKKVHLTKLFNPVIRLIGKFNGTANKVFGNFTYDMAMSAYDKGNYQITSFQDSICTTEGESRQ